MNGPGKSPPAKPLSVSADNPYVRKYRSADRDQQRRAPFYRRALLLQGAVFLLVLVLWPLPIINPLKLLVVLFHELSHMVAAYATGGVPLGLAIHPGGAGITLGFGGNQAVIAFAGYAGSLAIGCALYAMTAVWEPGEVWAVLLGLACVSLVFGWLNRFTAVFGYGAIFLMIAGLGLPAGLKRVLLRFVATASCLYPLFDIIGEFVGPSGEGFRLRGQSVGSDAGQIAQLTGTPVTLIVIGSCALGTVAVVLLVRWAAYCDAGVQVRRSLIRRSRMKPECQLYDPGDSSTIKEYTIR